MALTISDHCNFSYVFWVFVIIIIMIYKIGAALLRWQLHACTIQRSLRGWWSLFIVPWDCRDVSRSYLDVQLCTYMMLIHWTASISLLWLISLLYCVKGNCVYHENTAYCFWCIEYIWSLTFQFLYTPMHEVGDGFSPTFRSLTEELRVTGRRNLSHTHFIFYGRFLRLPPLYCFIPAVSMRKGRGYNRRF